MRSSEDTARWEITEDVPEFLGIAVAVREIRGWPGRVGPPDLRAERPSTAAHDAAGWQQWWSFLVAARVPGSPSGRASGADARTCAGDAWPAAKDLFAARKIAAARELAQHGLTSSAAWQRIVEHTEPSGGLVVDVVPGSFPFCHRVAPRYWVLSLSARLDDRTVDAMLDTEFPDPPR